MISGAQKHLKECLINAIGFELFCFYVSLWYQLQLCIDIYSCLGISQALQKWVQKSCAICRLGSVYSIKLINLKEFNLTQILLTTEYELNPQELAALWYKNMPAIQNLFCCAVSINEAPMKYDTAFICNIGSQCHDNTDFYKSFLLAVQTLNHLVTPAIFHDIERGEKKLEFRQYMQVTISWYSQHLLMLSIKYRFSVPILCILRAINCFITPAFVFADANVYRSSEVGVGVACVPVRVC